jgi:hypothetical protein
MCGVKLKQSISVNKVSTLLMTAHRHNSQQLKDLCIQYICEHHTEVGPLSLSLPHTRSCYGVDIATHNTQHTTHNTQHTTHNTQHTTHNTQHTTHNTQHTTLNVSVNEQVVKSKDFKVLAEEPELLMEVTVKISLDGKKV